MKALAGSSLPFPLCSPLYTLPLPQSNQLSDRTYGRVARGTSRPSDDNSRAMYEGNDENAVSFIYCPRIHLAALLFRGEGIEKTITRALELFNRAVDGGDLKAMNRFSCVFTEEIIGIETNADRAAELCTRGDSRRGLSASYDDCTHTRRHRPRTRLIDSRVHRSATATGTTVGTHSHTDYGTTRYLIWYRAHAHP